MKNLLNGIKVIDLHVAAVAAASSITDATVVDTQGYEGCVFMAKFGTSAVDNGLKVQQDTVVGFGGGADLEASKILLDGTSKVAIADVYRPKERFLKPIVLRGTSSTLDSLVAILYGPRKQPVTQGTTTTGELNVSPAEGTA